MNQKFLHTDNSEENICIEAKKSSKNGKEQKTLITTSV